MTSFPELTVRQDPDVVLLAIVDGINAQEEHQEGFPITLLVKGTVLTGKIVPNWQWFEEMETGPEPTGESDDGEADGFMKDLADQFAEQNRLRQSAYETPARDWTEEQRKAHDTETKFVHLTGASLLLGGGVMAPTSGGRFRVRLSDVDGWASGQLSVGRP